MKRMLWAAAITAAIVMTGCDSNAKKDATAVDATPADGATEAATAAGPAAAPVTTGEAAPAAANAPAFAVIYPGGEPKGPATPGMSPAGAGGILEFTTSASPDEVVAFYRQRAEAAGLKPLNAMNQNDARGYSAGDGGTRLLQVVASPIDGGLTDVLLTWTGGR